MNVQSGISRRDFVRYAASGAASLCLCGCAGMPKRGRPAPARLRPEVELADRDTFRRLADAALNASKADHTLVLLRDCIGGRTQYHDNQITDFPVAPSRHLSVVVSFGQQVGSGLTSELNVDAVVAAVRAAEERARRAAPNSDYLPPLPPQRYPVLPTYRPETAAAGRERRAAVADVAIAVCEAEGVPASGTVAAYAEAIGVAADTGLFAFEQRTHAGFDLTVSGPECAGRAGNIHRSIDDLGIAVRTRAAIRRAKLPAHRAPLPAGRYTVVLGPFAVARLIRLLLGATDARADRKGHGGLRDRLGHPVIDTRLTLQNRPDHPDLLGGSFDLSGLAADAATWIERGVLKRVSYDQRSAREHGTAPTYFPDAPHLSGEGAEAASLDDLVHATERGIVVTDLARVAYADPDELRLTGVTTNGAALIENGRIVAGLGGLRWRGELLAVLNQVDVSTTPLEAVADQAYKLLVPAIVVRDFAIEGSAS
jgi:predicted Zn-dependent protease